MSTITMRYKPKHFVNYHPDILMYYGFSWKVKYHRNVIVKKTPFPTGKRSLTNFSESSVIRQYSPYGGAVEVELFYQGKSLGKAVEVCDNTDIFVKKIGFYNAITKIMLNRIPVDYYIYVPNTRNPKGFPILDRARTVHNFISLKCD